MAYIPSHGMSQAKSGRFHNQGVITPPSTIMYARVTAVHRETMTVDLVLGQSGMPLSNVPVAFDHVSTRTGRMYIDRMTNNMGLKTDSFQTSSFTEDRTRTVYAVLTYVADDVNSPLVIGFIVPPTTQMTFNRDGFAIDRHESDQYSMTQNGDQSSYDPVTDTTISDFEWYHPSGFFVKIGTDGNHVDLTGKDSQGLWNVRGTPNANSPMRTPGPATADYRPVTVKHPSGTGVTLDDDFTIHTSPTGKALVNDCEILTECSDLTAIAPIPIFDVLGHALVDVYGNPVLVRGEP